MKEQKLSKWKRRGFFFVGIIITIIYLYSSIVVGDYKLSPTNLMYNSTPWDSENISTDGPMLSDPADSVLPTAYNAFKSEDGGGLWNSNISLGQSEELNTYMYPLNYIYILPFEYAIIIKSILEFLIAFFCMYFFLRAYELKRVSAAIGGVLYTFSSVMIVWHFWPHSDVMAFAPLLFLLTRKMILKKRWMYSIETGLVMALMLVAGMPTYVAYFVYLLGFYMLYLTFITYKKDWRSVLKVFVMFIVSVVIAVLISSPYTIELVSQVGSNGYSDSRKNYAKEILKPEKLLSLLFPFADKSGSGLEHLNECTLYTGVLSLIVIPLFFVNIKDKRRKNLLFWGVSGVIVLLLIFTHVLDFIFILMPAINTSLKVRVIVLLNFILSVISAVNVEDILDNQNTYRNRMWIYLTIFIVEAGIYCVLRRKHVGYELMMATDIVVFGSILILIMCMLKKVEIFGWMLVGVTAFGGASVAKSYFPLIEEQADVIPDATDSIQYVQKNISDGAKVLPTGNLWNMFANVNVYYGLDYLTGHGFGNTDEDMVEYITGISEDAYVTDTKTAVLDVDNYNLLKYLGVEYIMYAGDCEEEAVQSPEPMGVLTDGTIIQQEVTINSDNVRGLGVIFATYGRDNIGDGKVYLSVRDLKDNTLIAEEEASVAEIEDNQWYTIELPSETELYNHVVELTIEVRNLGDATITVWQNSQDTYEGDLKVDGENTGKDLRLGKVYDDTDQEETELVYTGNDGMLVYHLKEFNQRFELADQVYVFDSKESMLEGMKEEYHPDSVCLLEEDVKDEYLDMQETEDDERSIVVKQDTEDSVVVEVTNNQEAFLLMNEYYTDDWKVYVNGEEKQLLQGNYLTRAVYLEAGVNEVEFRYEPEIILILLRVSGVSLMISVLSLIVLYIYGKRIIVKSRKVEEK